MAELDVQPKRAGFWWLWLLLALVALVIIIFLFKGCNSTSGSAAKDDPTSASGTVAVTQPDWDLVDFNAAKASDADVTDPGIVVRGNERYTIYTLGENILFETDKEGLQGAAGDKLKQIAASLSKRYKGANIAVYGNTDSIGTARHNQQLGAARAAAVKDWLESTGGVAAGLVSIHSFGENKPVASNSTAGGREQNRNVSIVAFPNK
jgi:outer membrane protein OmpA-like peptidoglycan-associated protein